MRISDWSADVCSSDLISQRAISQGSKPNTESCKSAVRVEALCCSSQGEYGTGKAGAPNTSLSYSPAIRLWPRELFPIVHTFLYELDHQTEDRFTRSKSTALSVNYVKLEAPTKLKNHTPPQQKGAGSGKEGAGK